MHRSSDGFRKTDDILESDAGKLKQIHEAGGVHTDRLQVGAGTLKPPLHVNWSAYEKMAAARLQRPAARRMVDGKGSIGLLAYERRNIDIFAAKGLRGSDRPGNARFSRCGLWD